MRYGHALGFMLICLCWRNHFSLCKRVLGHAIYGLRCAVETKAARRRGRIIFFSCVNRCASRACVRRVISGAEVRRLLPGDTDRERVDDCVTR